MLDLKLAAQYNSEGKFEKFLELGKWFLFGGDFISVRTREANEKEPLGFIDFFGNFYKDEKDPLGRFNGLFNDRTYGDGRFVLVDNERDFVKQVERIVIETGERFIAYESGKAINSGRKNHIEINGGNLHENPELFEKL